MRKIVSMVVMTGMLFASSIAYAGNRDHRWGVDDNRRSPYYGHTYRNHRHYDRHRDYRNHRRDRGVNTGEAVAIGLGALIVGSIIANNRNTRNDNYEYRRTPQYVCQDVVQYDYYGNPYVTGRNCWYQ